MQVLLNTDNHVDGNDRLAQYVSSVVESSVDRFSRRITRVEVFLADENSSVKSGSNDKRCTMEARIGGMQPITVSANSPTFDQGIDAAADKLEKALSHAFGRLDASQNRHQVVSEETL